MTGTTIEAAGVKEILESLPHRYPFLMVDRVTDIRGNQHGVGIKNVTANEPQFVGHFPENPVMPGVLMLEGMAQTACILVLRLLPTPEKQRVLFFLTIDKAKFRKPAVPGDTIRYQVDKIAHRRTMWWYRAEAKVADVLIAEAEVGAAITEG